MPLKCSRCPSPSYLNWTMKGKPVCQGCFQMACDAGEHLLKEPSSLLRLVAWFRNAWTRELE